VHNRLSVLFDARRHSIARVVRLLLALRLARATWLPLARKQKKKKMTHIKVKEVDARGSWRTRKRG
jgi:hypothetical protein